MNRSFRFVFLDLYQLNRDTYNRVRHWFDQLPGCIRERIYQQIEGFPECDDLTEGSGNSSLKFENKREINGFLSS